MAPPSATQTTEVPEHTNGNEQATTATHEPGLSTSQAEKQKLRQEAYPSPRKFTDKYEEREYQKGRLALAFRIFAKFGFDEGVAGHITLRVCIHFEYKPSI
jgi:hypothetical protein